MGNVKPKTALKKVEDQYSLFVVTGPGVTLYLDVAIELIEFPDILVLSDPLESDAQLFDLEDGINLELVKIPGKFAPHRYGQGTVLIKFDEIAILRKVVRPMADDPKKLEICLVLRTAILEL